MSLWTKKRCAGCGEEGRFLSLSKQGLCARCQGTLEQELAGHLRELPAMDRRFQQLKVAPKRRELASEMVKRLERVVAIEATGVRVNVPTEVHLPSQWLDQYRSEHDWAAVEIVSAKFDALWDDLFHCPAESATLRKLRHVAELAESTLPELHKAETIAPIRQRIAEKLQQMAPKP